MRFFVNSAHSLLFIVAIQLFLHKNLSGQATVVIDKPDAFTQAPATWKSAGDIIPDYRKANTFQLVPGSGILVNMPGSNSSPDVFTKEQFSDVDIEFDYALTRESRSGIWIQGRYLLRLSDSWGEIAPGPADNGGIPFSSQNNVNEKGIQKGLAPRQNVTKAPGLWQHVSLSFRAPRFDKQGRKTDNAQLLQVTMNGVVIHDLISLEQPTEGGIGKNEVAAGPLGFIGTGGIAFRNFSVKKYDTPLPLITNINYQLFSGKFDNPHNIDTAKPLRSGALDNLSIGFIEMQNEYLVKFTGQVQIKEHSKYLFQRETMGGSGYVRIDGKLVSDRYSYDTDSIELRPGSYPLELVYSKQVNWLPASFGLSVSAPGIRATSLSDPSSIYHYEISPVYLEANDLVVHRSFIDLPYGNRKTHAVNIGSPQQLHYSYDLNTGSVLQAWTGLFLDVTPMWHNRGDGSSKARGARQVFYSPEVPFSRGSITDTAGAGFQPVGYELTDYNQPTFVYSIYNEKIRDRIEATDGGKKLTRTVTSENTLSGFNYTVACGNQIREVSSNLFVVDGQFYIEMTDKKKTKIVTSASRQCLQVPFEKTISFSIIP